MKYNVLFKNGHTCFLLDLIEIYVDFNSFMYL